MEKSRREARLERKRAEQRRSQMKWLLYIVVAAVIVTVLLIIGNQVRGPVAEREYTQADGNQLGDPSASVVVTEFADFQCPHCRDFYRDTEHLMVEDYVDTGQVLYELHIVDFLGPESQTSAEAAYCAADQNLFWEYHDVVFANFSNGNSGGYSQTRLIDFAQAVNGMDVDSFSACLASGEKADVVIASRQAAAELGITGTPGFSINGEILSGNQPYVQIQAAIENALANAAGN